MRTNPHMIAKLALVLCMSCTLSLVGARRAADGRTAEQIMDATGVKGGLVVHIGCGDGALTAALRVGENFMVHGLDADSRAVRAAGEHIRKLGLYGPVSVEQFDGKRLPYADNIVNLIVTEDLGGVTMAEVMRVLTPGGVLYAKQTGRWKKTVKPQPENTDEWTHFLHDAGGNAVAHDQVVGPPGHVQWIAEPRHTRSHEHTPSINALVSAGGRIFYIADYAPVSSLRTPAQWYLLARDAYNGILLWKRPIDAWFPYLVNWGRAPRQLQRRLVAAGDRIYVTLGLHSPLTAVNATTGDIIRSYDNTRGTEEVLYHKGILLLAVRTVTDERVAELKEMAQLSVKKGSPLHARETAEPLINRFRSIEGRAGRAILAIEADTGRRLWKKTGAEAAGLRAASLCAAGDRVFYQKGGDVVCRELTTGRELWSVPSAPLRLVCDDSVVCAGGKTIQVLSAEKGRTKWKQPPLLTDIRDAFVIKGSLWLGGFKPIEGKRGPVWGPYFATQRDMGTGKVLMHIEPENPGHHHRCWQNKATDRYILGGRRGVEFIDLQSGDVLWNSWVRGVCKYGVMPCNGLLYAPSHACGCYIAAKLTGFHALAPATDSDAPAARSYDKRLERGPAYSQSPGVRPAVDHESQWPTYRNDAQRTGRTRTAVPVVLGPLWRANVGGKLTSPTVATGTVFVASVDQHRVCAINADSGRSVWEFTAGARVDSPPTLYENQALFGCRDGCVYNLRASDGELAWRLRAARSERRVMVCGRLESASPIHGSVLVQNNAAYFAAGRSSYLDGGLDLYRVEPATGKVLSRTRIYSPDPETGKQPQQYGPAQMPGALADILTGDGQYIYLRDLVFNRRGGEQPNGNPHLLTLTGFLDGSWPHRSYWIFGTKCSLSTGCSGRDRNLVFGRLLVFDKPVVYGYGRANVHWSNQLQDGAYRLFAMNADRAEQQWARRVPIRVRAMVLADKVLFVAGPENNAEYRPQGAEESGPALLLAVSASDGTELGRCQLDACPVFDGMAAAGGRLYLSLENGRLLCMARK